MLHIMLTRFPWISNKNLFATIFFRTEFELERIVNVKIWSRENIDSPFEVSRSQKSTVFTRIRSKIQASGSMQLAHREDRFRMLRSILVKFLFPREISHIVESIKNSQTAPQRLYGGKINLKNNLHFPTKRQRVIFSTRNKYPRWF